MSRSAAANAELLRALAALAEPPADWQRTLAATLELDAPQSLEQWRADFTQTLVLNTYPYASVYLGEEGMLGGAARDRMAGFWRALHLTPPPEPDYLPVLLAAYAELVEHSGGDARWNHPRHAFFHEQIASWLPPWLERVGAQGSVFYAAWARLLHTLLEEQGQRLAAPPQQAASHLRLAPALQEPSDNGLEGFAASLLTPAVSGMILTREDLRRAAQAIGAGCRLGERRLMLRSLLEQNPGECLQWLASHANTAREAHGRWAAISPANARHWIERAAHAQQALCRLAAVARAAQLPSQPSRSEAPSQPVGKT